MVSVCQLAGVSLSLWEWVRWFQRVVLVCALAGQALPSVTSMLQSPQQWLVGQA